MHFLLSLFRFMTIVQSFEIPYALVRINNNNNTNRTCYYFFFSFPFKSNGHPYKHTHIDCMLLSIIHTLHFSKSIQRFKRKQFKSIQDYISPMGNVCAFSIASDPLAPWYLKTNDINSSSYSSNSNSISRSSVGNSGNNNNNSNISIKQ